MAVGTVQFTSAENVSRSAYATKGLAGHGTSNNGGRISDTTDNMLEKKTSLKIKTEGGHDGRKDLHRN